MLTGAHLSFPAMSLKKWERDVRNRQRNIVFPDTNLNEGRFYRNLASGKAVFSRGQKISLLIVPMYFLIILSSGIAGAISQVQAQRQCAISFGGCLDLP